MKTSTISLRLCTLLVGCAALANLCVAANIDEREAHLASRLRCMVCQNQTLAESNAPLAADMRQQIREQLTQGRSEDQIRSYFEERYGAFVRYDPPFNGSTWLLWLGPFALLGIGLLAMWHVVARRNRQAPPPLTPEERARAAALLEGETS
jgi:cytochrome c-type biogenesis protein CcmH